MKNENQGKTNTQREFAMFMFSSTILGLIILGLVYLIKTRFSL